MSLDGAWVPEDEEEDILMEDIHIATRRAHKRGVPKERIAALLAFMASAALDPRAEEESPDEAESGLEEAMDDEAEDEEGIPECPGCGEPVYETKAQMGGKVHMIPCRCNITLETIEDHDAFPEKHLPEEMQEDE